MKIIYDKTYHYTTLFNPDNGYYIRAFDVENEPFMAESPHLIDIGIMGHCRHGRLGLCEHAGIQCYQNAAVSKAENMAFSDYQKIIESSPSLMQVALGGAGDPDMHEDFEKILSYTREHDVVPNFTTSGFGMTLEKASICARYCGAVAVSAYSRLDENGRESNRYTNRAIDFLITSGVTTSMHFVLGNSTIDEAIFRLRENRFPEGIHAVIFLLHKNVGLGSLKNVLRTTDPRVSEFFSLVDKNDYSFNIGFDSCSTPAILNFTKTVNPCSIDTCEGARYSMYVSSDMIAYPCSFDNQDKKYAYKLDDTHTILDAWQSSQFERFRDHLRSACPSCQNRNFCMGGCPLRKNIILCDSANRTYE